MGRGFHPVHLAVPSHCLLDLSRDQLLDLLCRDTLPWGDCQSDAHGDVRVFPLGHVHVPKDAPDEGCEQSDPGDLTVIGKESRDVVAALLPFGFHFTTSTRCPSFSRFAPVVMTSSPAAKPFTTPDVGPGDASDLDRAQAGYFSAVGGGHGEHPVLAISRLNDGGQGDLQRGSGVFRLLPQVAAGTRSSPPSASGRDSV